MAINNDFRSKSKHIDTKFHFVMDLVKSKTIELTYLISEKMVADMMTKPFGAVKL